LIWNDKLRQTARTQVACSWPEQYLAGGALIG
jgi:hypothetical protein